MAKQSEKRFILDNSENNGSEKHKFKSFYKLIKWLGQLRASTSLTKRILAINLLVLIVPIGSFFFLDQYQRSLIESELDTLNSKAEVFAGAVGAGAVRVLPGFGQSIDPLRASLMLSRLTSSTNTRARLFAYEGSLIEDTQHQRLSREPVSIQVLPSQEEEGQILRLLKIKIGSLLNWLPGQSDFPIYRETIPQHALSYSEAKSALFGVSSAVIRRQESGGILISVSAPVQRYRQVIGALMLSTDGRAVELAMRKIRLDILQVFIFALGITDLLSLYLAGTIARPINRLASAAELVRTGHGRHTEIPDFSSRRDEIGELSRDLRGMTEALWKRMDEIERFAADVAHEIKNPLTSLRSAVETVARINDPEQQKQLISIIIDDVHRLDRLISDISDASRLDAELSRDVPKPIDLRSVLDTLIEIECNKNSNKTTFIECHLEEGADLTVDASEGRLGQVFLNIISNATSFSPDGKKVTVNAKRILTDENAHVIVTVDDEGQGIPEENLESIFGRFYTDRPIQELERKPEKYEVHSGLGLSISRQIVEAAGGQIWAENLRNDRNQIAGARIIVKLPASYQN